MMESASEKLLRICKIADAAGYLSEIVSADADPDFCCDVSKNADHIYAVCYDDEVVGLVGIQDDSHAYIYVCIFPGYRNRGYGYLAVCAAEQMCSSRCITIAASYDCGNGIAERLARKCGFIKKHESVAMTYSGEEFAVPALPIRKHRDEDFLEAYKLSAEAFHIMRLETGHDPNSVPYEPDDEIRQYCLETADERYVYLLDDEIIGCAHIEGAEIDNVAIKISHQGKGFGRAFVKFLTNEILKKGIGQPFLFCLVSNKKALRLYHSIGYTETRRYAYAQKQIRRNDTDLLA